MVAVAVATPKHQTSRIVYTTEQQVQMRGLSARVRIYPKVAWRKNRDPDKEGWGWQVVMVEDGRNVTYVSMGKPEQRSQRFQHHHACWVCDYASAELVGRPGELCDACRQTAIAAHAIRIQKQCGVNLGFRQPEFEDHNGMYGGGDIRDRATRLSARDVEGMHVVRKPR